MVPETSSETDRFCHFGLFFALLPPLQPRKSKFLINDEKQISFYTSVS